MHVPIQTANGARRDAEHQWAVVYVRPGLLEDRRRMECLAEARAQGLGVRQVTSDPVEAAELHAAGTVLVAAPEHIPDVIPGVIPARRAHRMRQQLGAVAVPAAAVVGWLRDRPVRFALVAAGSVAGMAVIAGSVPEQEPLVPPPAAERPPVEIRPVPLPESPTPVPTQRVRPAADPGSPGRPVVTPTPGPPARAPAEPLSTLPSPTVGLPPGVPPLPSLPESLTPPPLPSLSPPPLVEPADQCRFEVEAVGVQLCVLPASAEQPMGAPGSAARGSSARKPG